MPREQRRLRERKKAQTRQRIMEVTASLVRERGFSHTTIDEVTRRSEISPPTFYSYFASKDAVLRELAAEEMDGWIDGMRLEILKPRPLRDGLLLVYRSALDRVIADPALWHGITLAASSGAEWSHAFGETDDPDRFHEMMVGMLAAAQARGEVARRFDPSFMVSILESIGKMLSSRWTDSYPDSDLRHMKSLFEDAIDFFLDGARPRGSDFQEYGKAPRSAAPAGSRGGQEAADSPKAKSREGKPE